MSSEPALLPAISSGFESLERGKGGRRKEGGERRKGEGWEEEEQEGTKRARGGGVSKDELECMCMVEYKSRVWESVWEEKESSV